MFHPEWNIPVSYIIVLIYLHLFFCPLTVYDNVWSRVSGQGQYTRSLQHLDQSKEANNLIKAKELKYGGQTDLRTDEGADRQSGVTPLTK